MKKLAIIAPSDSPIPALLGGAVETLTTYFITENELNPAFEIDVYCVRNKKLDDISYRYTNIIQIERPYAYKLRKLWCSIYNRLASFAGIQKALFYLDKHMAKSIQYEKKYDFILVENNMNVFEYILKYRNGTEKLFFHLHNDVIDSVYKNKRLCEAVYNNCEKVFCASDYLLERMDYAVGGDRCKKNKLLTNCIDYDLFKAHSEDEITKTRNSLNIEQNDYVILYSGRITEEKGVLELVQAISQTDNNSIKCLIIGGNWFGSRKEETYIETIKRIVENDNRFIMVGQIDYKMLPIYYQLSDLTIIPSKWQEPFGMVALEALTMGCPIAITNRGGLKNIPDNNCSDVIDESEGLIIGIQKVISKNIDRSEEEKDARRKSAYKRAHDVFYGPKVYFDILRGELDGEKR